MNTNFKVKSKTKKVEDYEKRSSKRINQYKFVKAEESPLFKFLMTTMFLEHETLRVLHFKVTKSGIYECKYLKNCRIKLEEYEFNGYEGVLVRIYDDYRKEIVTSRNLKINYTGVKWLSFSNAKCIVDECQENVKEINNAFSISDFYSSAVGIKFTCEFKTFDLSKSKKLNFDIMAEADDVGGVEKFYLGIGCSNGKSLNKTNFHKVDYQKIFKRTYKEFWGDNIDLLRSPYFNLFNSTNN
jgi:hypothetical protein